MLRSGAAQCIFLTSKNTAAVQRSDFFPCGADAIVGRQKENPSVLRNKWLRRPTFFKWILFDLLRCLTWPPIKAYRVNLIEIAGTIQIFKELS